MPTVVHDLPGGRAKRIKQTTRVPRHDRRRRSRARDGEHTGALPGTLIRGPLAHSTSGQRQTIERGASMSDYPWIISVDDHVVEPPTLWTERLPAHDRDVGRGWSATPAAPSPIPRHSRCATSKVARARHRLLALRRRDQGGSAASWPVSATRSSGTRANRSPTKRCDPVATTRSSDSRDMDLEPHRASLCFPFITRFCGQMFLEAKDKELASLCVRAYNDWMIEEWCGDSRRSPDAAVLDPAVGSGGSRPTRSVATRPRGMSAITFTEMPHHLRPAVDP